MLALGIVRLIASPVDVPVAGMLADAIRSRTGVDVEIGSVAVHVGVRRPELQLREVRVRGDAFAASVGRIVVSQGLSGRSVAIHEAGLRLDPTGDRAAAALPVPGEAIAALDRAVGAMAEAATAAGLGRLTLDDGRLDVVGAGRPITEARVFQNLTATLEFAGGVRADIAMIGAGGAIAVALDRQARPDGTTLDIEASGIVPRDLGPAGAVQSGFALSPRLTAELGSDGRVSTAEVVIGIGEGTVILGPDPMRRFDSGRIAMKLRPDGRTLDIGSARFAAAGAHIDVAGTISPGTAALDPWAFDLSATDTVLDSDDIGKPPVVFDSFRASGRIDLAGRLIHVDELEAANASGQASAVMTFDFGELGPRISGAAHVGPSTVDAILGSWPSFMAYDPRMAVADTVLGGLVRRGDVEFALTREDLDGDPDTLNPAGDALAIDVEFVNATFTAPDAPLAVTKATGALRLRGPVLSVHLDSGRIPAREGGELVLTEGSFTIPKLGTNPAEATMTAAVEGPLSAVVGLAERFNIKELEATRLTPADVTGTVTANVAFVTPLGPNVPDSARRWSIDAQLTDAASGVPVNGQKFTDGNINVAIDNRRLAARGRAKIDGLAIDVNYSEVFAGEKSGGARFVLTDKDRRDRGFDTGALVRGPVVITVEQAVGGERSFEADFSEAAIAIPGYVKEAGKPLGASGVVAGEGAAMDVTSLEMEGGGLAIEGSLSVEGGGLKRAAFKKFGLREGDRAEVEIARSTAGTGRDGFRIAVNATQFDARRLVSGATASPKDQGTAAADGKKKTPPLHIVLSGQRVRLTDAASVSDLTLEAAYSGTRMEELSISGRLDGVNVGTFAGSLAPVGDGQRRLQADVTELGRVLAAFDVYERMRGGRATVDARMDDRGVMRGRLTVGPFQLADEKSLEDIIARARPQQGDSSRPQPLGFQAAAPAEGSAGLAFDRLMVEFEKTGDVVTITDAILRGQLIGGTATGVVDLKAKTVTLNGTLIPAFGVNNLFGRVPVFGELLGAGREGGLFGVTFQLAGDLKKPELSWNPLSAVAPGIFRRIFEYR